jgi:hypothetical protein
VKVSTGDATTTSAVSAADKKKEENNREEAMIKLVSRFHTLFGYTHTIPRFLQAPVNLGRRIHRSLNAEAKSTTLAQRKVNRHRERNKHSFSLFEGQMSDAVQHFSCLIPSSVCPAKSSQ